MSMLIRFSPSGNGGPLLSCRTDALERKVELVVRGVQVVQQILEGRRRIDVIANGQEDAMCDVHEDREFVEIVWDR